MRSQDPFQIPRAGFEVAPLAGLASINVNGSVGPVPATEFLMNPPLAVWRSTPSQALLTGLRTERCANEVVKPVAPKSSWLLRLYGLL